jgi:LmbE family N-acetylglucosaminyl deacetylase
MPQEVVRQAPARALAVYGHPDDPEIAAGGTLARWAEAGCEVFVLVCTRGEKGSSDPAIDPAELAARRERETAEATAVLGLAGAVHLGHPDGGLDNTEALRSEIVGHVRRLRPDVVVCPDPTAVFFGDSYVNHRDHRATGWATLDAVAPAAANPHYVPEHPGPHAVAEVWLSGTFEPNVAVDVTATIERKIDALFCHASQLTDTGEWFREFLRDRAREEGRATNLRFAETFRRLRLT